MNNINRYNLGDLAIALDEAKLATARVQDLESNDPVVLELQRVSNDRVALLLKEYHKRLKGIR